MTGLEYWGAAARDEIDPRAVARLAAHPRAGEAMRRSVAGGLAYFDSDFETNDMFRDWGAFGLGVIALQLDATGGITHRRLRQISQSSLLLSSGRASAILALLRLKGFVRRDSEGGQVRYRPEPPLARFFRRRMRIELEAVSVVEPAAADLAARWDEADVFARFMGHLGREMVRAAQKPQQPDLAAITRIGERRSGMLILYHLMLAADRGADFPHAGPFAVSVSGIAKRFALSRSHVLRTLRLIAQEGLIAREGAEGGGRFLPAHADIFPRYWAIGLAGILACAHRTLAEAQSPTVPEMASTHADA